MKNMTLTLEFLEDCVRFPSMLESYLQSRADMDRARVASALDRSGSLSEANRDALLVLYDVLIRERS